MVLVRKVHELARHVFALQRVEQLDAVIHRVIAERRAGSEDPLRQPDLVSMLLAARDPENPDAQGMSDQQIRDEAMTIFLAGHETTANAMAWTWHLLGSNPHVEATLHGELARVLGGRTPSVEDVPKLEYTRAVIAESMRMYPPVWTMGRRAIEKHVIAGHTIAPGALVIMSQWIVHHDPRWWSNPQDFLPERWLASSAALGSAPSAARPKYAYFPFGGGPRMCIGSEFALMEGVLALATIAREYRVRPVLGHRVEPEALITLRPRGGLPILVERRATYSDRALFSDQTL